MRFCGGDEDGSDVFVPPPATDPVASAGRHRVPWDQTIGRVPAVRKSLLVASALTLGACGSGGPGEASEANFEAVLDDHYAERPECVRVGKAADADGMIAQVLADDLNRDRDVSRLDALAAQGLLDVQDVAIERTDMLATEGETEKARRYVLTEEGRASLRPKEQASSFRRSASAFCYGRRDVTAITNFTEPAEAFGELSTSIGYEYEVTDVPAWARSEAVQAAFPEIAKQTSGTAFDTDDLVLTNAGWLHNRDAP